MAPGAPSETTLPPGALVRRLAEAPTVPCPCGASTRLLTIADGFAPRYAAVLDALMPKVERLVCDLASLASVRSAAGVTVNALHPGLVKTPLLATFFGIVVTGIIIIGYTFNAFGPLFV